MNFVKIYVWTGNRELRYPPKYKHLTGWVVGMYVLSTLSLQFASGFLLHRHVRQKKEHKERDLTSTRVYCKYFLGKLIFRKE